MCDYIFNNTWCKCLLTLSYISDQFRGIRDNIHKYKNECAYFCFVFTLVIFICLFLISFIPVESLMCRILNVCFSNHSVYVVIILYAIATILFIVSLFSIVWSLFLIVLILITSADYMYKKYHWNGVLVYTFTLILVGSVICIVMTGIGYEIINPMLYDPFAGLTLEGIATWFFIEIVIIVTAISIACMIVFIIITICLFIGGSLWLLCYCIYCCIALCYTTNDACDNMKI